MSTPGSFPPGNASQHPQQQQRQDGAAMYSAVAARRLQWDNMLWQVPTLSLTGQAFLFTIALGSDSSRTARAIACVLSMSMTFLSMHLMTRHRQAEWTDAHWLEEYETNHFGESWHGTTWAKQRNREPGVGWPGSQLLARLRGYQVWMTGLAIFGLAAAAVLILTILWPSVLTSGPAS